MHIRPAEPNDIAAITLLWEERMVILSQTDARFKARLDNTNVWVTEIRNRLQRPDALVFVAIEDDTIVGFITGEVRDGIGAIDDIALDAHEYHGGLGRALVRAARQSFGEQGVTESAVRVPRYHPVEQAFWLAMGCKEWKDDAWQTPREFIWMTF